MYLGVCPFNTAALTQQTTKRWLAEWMCGVANAPANWTGTEVSSVAYMQMQLQNPILFAENSNRPEDATVYHATNKVWCYCFFCRIARSC